MKNQAGALPGAWRQTDKKSSAVDWRVAPLPNNTFQLLNLYPVIKVCLFSYLLSSVLAGCLKAAKESRAVKAGQNSLLIGCWRLPARVFEPPWQVRFNQEGIMSNQPCPWHTRAGVSHSRRQRQSLMRGSRSTDTSQSEVKRGLWCRKGPQDRHYSH